MSQAAHLLTIQFLEWLAAAPRSYPEVMEAWRTSCPRLSIWEDAAQEGLVRLEGGGPVKLTRRGRALLNGEEPPIEPEPPAGRA
jgi:hypothetical protein